MKFLPTDEADYVIARRTTRKSYEVFSVAKFIKGDIPDVIHYVTVTPKVVSCTCPGYTRPDKKRPCRHCLMVAMWVLNGDKDPEIPHA